MDLNTLNITDSDWSPKRAGRPAAEKGPNPFVQSGILLETFRTGKAKAVTVEGHFEEVNKNDRKGNPVTRRYVRGEAEEVIKLLRAAAEEITASGTPIGVTLNPVAGRRKGTITVHFMGQKRKESRKGSENAQG